MIANADPRIRRNSLLQCLLAYLTAGTAAWAAGRALVLLAPHLLRQAPGPLLIAAAADLAATIVIFLFSMGADNSSMYDPYWSVAPVFIALYWLVAYQLVPGRTGLELEIDLRQAAVLVLIGVWGARLTCNWAGGWPGLNHEDWRYRGFRRKAGRAYWLVSFFGIHLFPTVIVFLGLLPVHMVMRDGAPVGLLDLAAAAVTVSAIALEAAADRQLRRFRSGPPADGAVMDRGLWALMRHPNYLGEVLFWWGLLLFGIAAAPGAAWTVVGPAAMTLLFVLISVPLMDAHMEERRPGYRERTAGRPALLPDPRRLFGRGRS